MDDGNGFIQGQTYNRSEIEKKWYIDVVFSKHPLMIKLEWDSIKVYCKGIQLRNSFWDENCEYLLVLFFSDFTAIFVFNEQRISTFILICNSWGVTAGALTCVTSSFMLLCPLLLVINAHYKCITYLLVHPLLNDEAVNFWTHSLPPYSYLHIYVTRYE